MMQRQAPLYARLEAYIASKGLRSTTQRRCIADAFFSGPRHLTIEELLARVREQDPQIGYATVYRTLKLFAECGLAAERDFGDGRTRYELSDESNEHHHDHLICLVCGKIIEFHNEKIEALQIKVADKLGFRIERHNHEIYGSCASCVASEAR
ncbi:MAG: transcriptional repressor [Myxococcales bacterium]|nr:transcriptional repressor [Myxococcales bacterium]